jgi:hypothetical protein
VEYLGSRLSSMLQAKIVRKQILSTFLPAAWAFFRKQAKLFWGSLRRILWRRNFTLYFFWYFWLIFILKNIFWVLLIITFMWYFFEVKFFKILRF